MGFDAPTPEVTPGGELRRSYEAYFNSGHYDRRYPAPNRVTLARLRAALPQHAHLLDFGCGSGRYLLPLRPHVARAAGFDICPAALALLRTRAAAAGWSDLAVLGPDPAALSEYIARHGPADVVTCLFGVLAHIDDPDRRRAALAQIYAALRPEGGRLLISVPNRARRFFAEQRAAGPGADGLIRYRRDLEGTHVTLPYQLFDPARLRHELETAGFTVTRLAAESVLPESWLLNHAPLRLIDAILTRICPPQWGYGILAEAHT